MKPRSTQRQVVAILLLSLAAATLSAFFHPKRPPWYRVASPDELRWRLSVEEATRYLGDEDTVWIDARSREKTQQGQVPDSTLLNLEEWGDLMFANLDLLQGAMGKRVIVYCDSKDCGKSVTVAERLRELVGLDPVYVLHGDWRDLDPAFAE